MRVMYYKWSDGKLELHNPITNFVSEMLCNEVVISPKEAMLNPSSDEFSLGMLYTSSRAVTIMEIVNPSLELGITEIKEKV